MLVQKVVKILCKCFIHVPTKRKTDYYITKKYNIDNEKFHITMDS